jgi:hypothetical protein
MMRVACASLLVGLVIDEMLARTWRATFAE